MENFDFVVATVDSSVGQLRVQAVSQPRARADLLVVTVPAIDRITFQLAAPAEQAALASAFTAAVLPSCALGGLAGHCRPGRRPGRAAAGAVRGCLRRRLPWELLYDADRAVFFGRVPRTPLVRYLPGPIPHEPAVLPPTATVLLTGASPKGLPPVDLAAPGRR